MEKIIERKRIAFNSGDTFRLKPISDVHFGSTHCDINAFRNYLSDSDDKTYFIGIGDLLDSIIVTDKRYKKSNDASIGDAIVDESVSKMVEMLRPYKDRILGLGIGNHEQTVVENCGTNPVKRICAELNTLYLGYMFFLTLLFSRSGVAGTRTLVILGLHGWGGGSRTLGADLTKYSRTMGHYEADIYLYGHVHKCQHTVEPRLSLYGGKKLINKDRHICICGTFLKTHSDTTDVTYSEMKGYPPTKIGGLTIFVKPTKEWMDIKVQT